MFKTALKRLAGKFGNYFLVNNAGYWDRYALLWRLTGKCRKYEFLGNEWKGEEIFLQLLEKYSVGRPIALEIGCGGGRITAHATEHFNKLYATDVSRRMVEQCRKALQNHSSIEFLKTDGFTLREFNDRSVNFVFSHDVFVHFSSLQVHPYLCEIKRVLRANGIALLSFYNFAKHFPLFKEMALGYSKAHQIPPHMRVHFLTQEMLRLMSVDAGFNIIELNTENYLIAVLQPVA